VELVDDEDPVEELGGGCCPERLGEGVRRWRPDQSLDDLPEARASASYADLVDRVESRGRQRKPNGTIRTDFARSAAAPRAVLLRSGGKCESPPCTLWGSRSRP
jgi:hypothetical protein